MFLLKCINSKIIRLNIFLLFFVISLIIINNCSDDKNIKQISSDYNCDDFNDPEIWDTRYRIAKTSYLEGSYEDALEVYNNILIDAYNTANKLKIILTKENIGLLYIKMGKYQFAEKTFNEIEFELHKMKKQGRPNIKYLATNYENIGRLQKKLKKYSDSTRSFETALNIYIKCKQLNRVIICLNHIGANYFHEGKYDESLNYFVKAAYVDRTNSYKISLSLSYFYLGKIYILKKDYKKAKYYLHNALRLDRERKSTDNIFQDLKLIAEIYVLEDNWLKAQNYYSLCYEVLKNIDKKKLWVDDQIINVLNNLINLYKKTKDEKSFKYYQDELDKFRISK
ncbi:MAG: tetratricopeptide repeat protein [Spirochaetota bacterium]|nr:tetratricopeptide repeat protein [Spirochaetota bacterium]